MVSLEEIEEILLKYYDNSDSGCFVNGVWLSINNIIEILKKEV